MLKTPIAASLAPGEMTRLAHFMEDAVADQDQTVRQELERLRPYLRAFSRQLKSGTPPGRQMARLCAPAGLAALFGAMAAHTGTVILSEIAVAPVSAAGKLRDHFNSNALTGKVDDYIVHTDYRGRKHALGFLQIAAKGGSSVSFPLRLLDDGLLRRVSPFRPQAMLRHLQAAATAGNHDTLHHFTSIHVNTHIARKRREPGAAALVWSGFFTPGADRLPYSYENWAIFSHARIRAAMDPAPLREGCDAFFDELSRIAKDMAAKGRGRDEVHETVDYFGTLYCAALLRFLPPGDPLAGHAAGRLEKADPLSAQVPRDPVVQKFCKKLARVQGDLSYADIKKIQALSTAPWIIGPLRPSRLNVEWDRARRRVPLVDREMIACVARETGCRPPRPTSSPAT